MVHFTEPDPVDRKVPRRGPAYREMVRIRKRIIWRLTKMGEALGSWSWPFVAEQVRRWRDDEQRLTEIIETWWPDLADAVRAEQATRAKFVELHENRVAVEARYETGTDPRVPSGTMPQ